MMEMAINVQGSTGIQEMSLDEIETINGGIAPLIAAALVVGGVIAVGFVAGAIAGYFANSE